ncbi:MAG: multifunctional CCA addition/repair protein [Betaproteobacteria bacterium]|nr:multifunctional CCA addition/repair protein [Betaproteobacteria bacterium]
MEIYAVGGCIRDELLGLPVQDRDYVVVGSTPERMLAEGYKPVGRDFPVFLHPATREEYALARTERKTAPGYAGFAFHAAADVTLEQDLARRDLTINAMARAADGTLIDPYGGQRDLAGRVLRHVGPAFTEDPVRVLRLARFAARFPDFTLAEETETLLRDMVRTGEVDHLVPERTWQELSRGLMERRPSRLLEVLWSCGATARILPEIDRLFGVPQPAAHHPERDTGVHLLLVVDYAASQGFSLPVRFAALTHDLGKGETQPEDWPTHYGHEQKGVALVEALCARLKVPGDCRDLAVLAALQHGNIHRAAELRPATMVRLLEQCDAIRRPERFQELMLACACDFHGRPGYGERSYEPLAILEQALAAARGIDAAAVAAATPDHGDIAARVHEERVRAVRAALSGN